MYLYISKIKEIKEIKETKETKKHRNRDLTQIQAREAYRL